MTITKTPTPSPTSPACAIAEPATTVNTTWTPEMLYTDPAERMPLTWDNLREALVNDYSRDVYGFTAAALAAATAETSWEWAEELPPLPAAIADQVGKGEMACPTCKGNGETWRVLKGRDTGLEVLRKRDCVCRVYCLFWSKWKTMSSVNARFADVRLRSLVPNTTKSMLPEDRQVQIISLLQASPDDSYLLLGDPNCGKTHYMSALYRHAVAEWARQQAQCRHTFRQSVWRISVADLLEEHHAWATKRDEDVPEPTVMVHKIHEAAKDGFRPRLFLDEIDKSVKEGFKMDTLFKLLNAMYEAKGQIVATGNKSVEELETKWGADEAGTALRRIGIGEGAHTLNFTQR
jgi:hypothetical protein